MRKIFYIPIGVLAQKPTAICMCFAPAPVIQNGQFKFETIHRICCMDAVKIFKITVLLNGPIYSCCYSEFNFLIPVMFQRSNAL